MLGRAVAFAFLLPLVHSFSLHGLGAVPRSLPRKGHECRNHRSTVCLAGSRALLLPKPCSWYAMSGGHHDKRRKEARKLKIGDVPAGSSRVSRRQSATSGNLRLTRSDIESGLAISGTSSKFFRKLIPLRDIGIEGVEIDKRDDGDLEIDIEVQQMASEYFLKVHMQSHLLCTCNRCLEEFHLPISSDFSLVLASRRKLCQIAKRRADDVSEISENKDLVDDSIIDFSAGINYIDLDPEVGESLGGAIPLRKVCSPTCKGRCATCGQNLNLPGNTCRCRRVPQEERQSTGSLNMANLQKLASLRRQLKQEEDEKEEGGT
ncbi:hypothetical protein GUITHDRAFT_141270 [Guillardia theta CCMP2712]|uniref:Uncharacterized protein n=1 Tax=Guillardia theta (strain CCMP2712) TaxID=905079 RepID=L1J1C1_GUITC|nr:hypothetical protein GUITHDRAFT_141270 [Guillardia theta CCMP2712]EKX42318.1 hypothetical protein GUITHDRAFT_141270 [Guillardia theta CCMP2712]|eukprot:XP_005829298.1 hypothetical protein GUITHDRAFT_141270 [Guillardia theta CCMP2712]